MAFQPRILAFSGSTRSGSYNKKLLEIAAAGARDAGAEVTILELKELALPLYDGDLEAGSGLPAGGRKLKDLMLAHHGFLIASPEYNSSISAALKNAIDWASRPVPGEKPLAGFTGKVAGLVSASPGALGGLRGLFHVRSILSSIQVLVLPEQVSVTKANEAFNPDGSLKDAKQQEAARSLGGRLTHVIAKLNG